MINQITLIGRLGGEPEERSVGDRKVTRLRVATDNNYKKDGEWVKETDWHTVEIWRELNVNKGDLVYIDGRVSYREHEGKWYTTVKARTVRVLNSSESVPEPSVPAKKEEEEVGSDGLPF